MSLLIIAETFLIYIFDHPLGDDDQDKNCDEKTDVSVEVLEDRIAVLACKMEKHAEQEQEACTLIIENGELIHK